jgi:hypothetical protein
MGRKGMGRGVLKWAEVGRSEQRRAEVGRFKQRQGAGKRWAGVC